MSAIGRTVPLPLHGAIEVFLAPVVMAAPFVLGLGTIASAAAIVVGAVLLGTALSLVTENRTISLSAHAGFDYVLAYFAMVAGIAAGVTGDIPGMILLVGAGAAMALLTTSTRFSIARGA